MENIWEQVKRCVEREKREEGRKKRKEKRIVFKMVVFGKESQGKRDFLSSFQKVAKSRESFSHGKNCNLISSLLPSFSSSSHSEQSKTIQYFEVFWKKLKEEGGKEKEQGSGEKGEKGEKGGEKEREREREKGGKRGKSEKGLGSCSIHCYVVGEEMVSFSRALLTRKSLYLYLCPMDGFDGDDSFLRDCLVSCSKDSVVLLVILVYF